MMSEGAKPRKKRRNNKWSLTIIALILAIAIVGIAAYLIYNHFFVTANNTYDAQMRIGDQQLKLDHLDEAEAAYKQALIYKDGDYDASVTLAEIYEKKKQYEDAAALYAGLHEKDENNIDLYDRLIALYAEHLDAVEKANELITKAYELGLTLTSDLVPPLPEFSPKGGTFNQATKVKLTAPDGYTIRYVTKKGTVPTAKSKKYKKAISISANGSKRIIAAVFSKEGLMGWPAENIYKIKLQVAVDNSAIANLGRSSKAIMNSVGPLFYSGELEGGFCYKDNSSKYTYVFSASDFPLGNDDEEGEDGDEDGGSRLDPESMSLPAKAKCVALSMTVGNYIVQPSGAITVKDFMAGMEIEDYEVRPSDGANHLIYDADGARYDITLPDKENISPNQVMTVYLISAA
ncbi:MAG: chitobiase/beta-hexosaminidase C-terminal domain-containing protein [Clostridiales Family XIII bacterium]|jgi:tetratricopeptide (TPR) repeat protein|nr:chitobiase/beta-hexosaminidase C-terminal domain-containing protein [Clostridiales Family XIII bacterium]